MKEMITAVALAAATLGGMAVAPATALAQPHGRYWHGPARGPGYRAWRHHYRGRWHRDPVRVCRHGRCWYR